MKYKKFIDEVVLEAKKVEWPARKEVTMATMMIIVAVIVSSIFFVINDVLAFKVINFLLNI